MRCFRNILLVLVIIKSQLIIASAPQIKSFADIVEPLIPSVVNIYTVRYKNKINKTSLSGQIMTEKLTKFFKKYNIPFSFNNNVANKNFHSLGSGFIIDAEGYIVTNNHVVSDSDEIYVKLYDGSEFLANIVGKDSKTDLALLKINAKNKLSPIEFAISNKARIGDVVIAIGNPFGFGGSVTTGIISFKSRDLGFNNDELVDNFIQSDAVINSGSSGGPLCNIDGKVIGLNTAITNFKNSNHEGISFAIPSDIIKPIISKLKNKGKISRGKLDISIQDVTKEILEAMSLNVDYGVLVVNLLKNGAGDNAGLKIGDLIISYNDHKVINSRKLQILVAESNIGDEVRLLVMRDNKAINLTAKITELKSDNITNKITEIKTLKKSNVVFSDLSKEISNKYQIHSQDKGVVVIKLHDNVSINLQEGDLIMSINKQNINNIDQFNNIYNNIKDGGKQKILLLVKRKEISMYITWLIK